MIKKFLYLFTVFALLLGFASCGGGIDYDNLSFESYEKTAECTPLLYKVSGNNGAELYLLGSVHIGDERIMSMPDYVMDAYNDSSYICVEVDIVEYEKNIAKQFSDLNLLRCPLGETVRDHMDKGVYRDMKSFLQSRGLYNATYEQYMPSFWSSLVDEALRSCTDLTADCGVDRYFLNQSKTQGKEIKEVESIDFQNALLAGFSDELYELLIASSIYNPEESVNQLNSMYETWLSGDEKAIEKMLQPHYEGLPEAERALVEDYNNKMLFDRNVGMADKAEEYMSEGGTGFYIVGMAHIVGDGAIVNLLRNRGYTVEKVPV